MGSGASSVRSSAQANSELYPAERTSARGVRRRIQSLSVRSLIGSASSINSLDPAIDEVPLRDMTSVLAAPLPPGRLGLVLVRQKRIKDFYEVVRTGVGTATMLGMGSSANVYKSVSIRGRERYAVKRVDFVGSRRLALAELDALRHMDHPNIIRLQEAFFATTGDVLFFVLEECCGGDLYTYHREQGAIEEQRLARYMRQMLSAVSHIHSLSIVHRDLKLENWVFRDKAKDQLVLIDFGLSAHFEPGRPLKKCVGSSYYLAPEVIERNYGSECDLWSLGVILYVLLTSRVPYGGETDREIMNRIVKRRASFNAPEWIDVSDQARELCFSLLSRVPSERPSARSALAHPWIEQEGNQFGSRTFCRHVKAGASRLWAQLKDYANLPLLKRLVFRVLAHHAGQDVRVEGIDIFCAIDTAREGHITADMLAKFLPTVDETELEEIFKHVDLSGVGHLTVNAFLAVFFQGRKLLKPELSRAFHHIAQEGGEVLTEECLTAFVNETVPLDTIVSDLADAVSFSGPHNVYPDDDPRHPGSVASEGELTLAGFVKYMASKEVSVTAIPTQPLSQSPASDHLTLVPAQS